MVKTFFGKPINRLPGACFIKSINVWVYEYECISNRYEFFIKVLELKHMVTWEPNVTFSNSYTGSRLSFGVRRCQPSATSASGSRNNQRGGCERQLGGFSQNAPFERLLHRSTTLSCFFWGRIQRARTFAREGINIAYLSTGKLQEILDKVRPRQSEIRRCFADLPHAEYRPMLHQELETCARNFISFLYAKFFKT